MLSFEKKKQHEFVDFCFEVANEIGINEISLVYDLLALSLNYDMSVDYDNAMGWKGDFSIQNYLLNDDDIEKANEDYNKFLDENCENNDIDFDVEVKKYVIRQYAFRVAEKMKEIEHIKEKCEKDFPKFLEEIKKGE